MNTLVCNTLSGAVSEYTRHDFHALTPTHGGSATGLYALASGDTDDGLPIVAELRLPATIRENTLKKHLEMVYLSMRGAAARSSRCLGRTRSAGPTASPSWPPARRGASQAAASARTTWASA
ncbi:hypothetical protein [Delftia lacustris]|uniref:hypothetical protein n=1 Tax=Delftia lacustris TaxID=558537 RepID=UPI001EF12EC7|nr:hypothetical protein [Delftia lacustris]